MPYLFISYNIISWLYTVNGFRIIFLLQRTGQFLSFKFAIEKNDFLSQNSKIKKSLKNQQQVATIRPLDSFTWIIVWSAWSSQSFERHLRGIASKDRAKSEIGPKIKILKPCQNKAYTITCLILWHTVVIRL